VIDFGVAFDRERIAWDRELRPAARGRFAFRLIAAGNIEMRVTTP
jgi:hypothetical protein